MLPLLALTLLQQADIPFRQDTLDGLLGKGSLMIRTPTERLPKPKFSPKQGWEFDWSTAGYMGNADRMELRFELFSQESTQGSARPESVMRTLLRLFSYNRKVLNMEHSPTSSPRSSPPTSATAAIRGASNCSTWTTRSTARRSTRSTSTTCAPSPNPVETTREVAHEYGHATLPAVGGSYTAPEAWSNGLLGEKLYLSYLAEARSKGDLGPEDTFGATPEALRAWVRKNVDPLVDDALANGPRPTLLAGQGQGFDGLVPGPRAPHRPALRRRAAHPGALRERHRFPPRSPTRRRPPPRSRSRPRSWPPRRSGASRSGCRWEGATRGRSRSG